MLVNIEFRDLENFIYFKALYNIKVETRFDNEIYEEGKNLVVELMVPRGLNEEEIKVSVKDNMLNIVAEKKVDVESKAEDYYSREQKYGSFAQQISLPVKVNSKKVKKEYEDGFLRVVIVKKK